jgi:hypothetical protein
MKLISCLIISIISVFFSCNSKAGDFKSLIFTDPGIGNIGLKNEVLFIDIVFESIDIKKVVISLRRNDCHSLVGCCSGYNIFPEQLNLPHMIRVLK